MYWFLLDHRTNADTNLITLVWQLTAAGQFTSHVVKPALHHRTRLFNFVTSTDLHKYAIHAYFFSLVILQPKKCNKPKELQCKTFLPSLNKNEYADFWCLLPLLPLQCLFRCEMFFRMNALTNENFVFPVCLVTIECEGHPATGLSELSLHEVGLSKLIFCQPWRLSCKVKEHQVLEKEKEINFLVPNMAGVSKI